MSGRGPMDWDDTSNPVVRKEERQERLVEKELLY